MKTMSFLDHESWSPHLSYDPVSSSSRRSRNVSFFRIQSEKIYTIEKTSTEDTEHLQTPLKTGNLIQWLISGSWQAILVSKI